MDAISRGLLTAYLAQALVGLVQVGIFAHFYRVYRQDYLRYWTGAFAALCLYQVAAGAAAYVAAADSAGLGGRLVWSWSSQVATYVQIALLMLGSLSVGRERPIGRANARRLLLAAALLGTMVSLAYAFSADGALPRVWLRVGLRYVVCGLAFLATAVLLARRQRGVPGLGVRFVTVAFALYGLMLLQEFGFFAWQFVQRQRIAGIEYLGLLDLVAQACIGFGLIIWVADEERRRADRATQENERARSYDAATGLPNRHHALRLLEVDLGDKLACAVLAIDYPELDGIAKSIGVAEAENIATQAAARLKARLGPGGRLSRVYAHRFLLCLPASADSATLATYAENLLDDLQRAYDADGASLSLRVAVGIAVGPGDGQDAATLVRHAEAAAQGTGTRIAFYSAERAGAARRRLEFAGEVRAAFANGQFSAYFQPIVGASRHAVVAFEVLARWRHPQRGLLLPVDFLGTLEERGLLPALDAQLLGEACAWAARHAGAAAPAISVNVSAHAFEQDDFHVLVQQALRDSGLDARRLQIEITESTALADVARTRATLRALRADGVRVALDDFGTGYSSLAQLRDLPVDTLKIDRSFVQTALHDPKTAAIVDSIVLLARKLGLDVVAEGVELRREIDHFENLGVTQLQGFAFGPAVEGAAADALVGAWLEAKESDAMAM